MRRNSWSAFFCKRKKAKTSGGAWPASGGDTADGGSEMGSRERKKAATSSSMNHEKPTEFDASTSSSAVVNVESLARGFLISVYLEKNSPGLLIRILEAFEKLGLEVLDANVSCSDCFQLQAVGEENEDTKIVKPQVVKKAVKQAIKEWSESNAQT
ncbi:uncharacterized protein LOC111786051 isoform X2 [Cucurbita pepo subsp. pepo]|uniref:uncharacterized protein LOC111781937 n=1 Tax=Cucurbita pepo subsp. pepo TaxID=3664 RepID=UPI000C9D35B1|nr:uncharacterized protein LOC111781937 [Cucurbita pepo subsp. pepo]XP_023522174.1 uncharacterized protein LOC111786051 isoform X2 [Cucurbita pepo subsp. pepo]